MANPISPALPKSENSSQDESKANNQVKNLVPKELSEIIYSRNGLSAADKMDKQLRYALIDPSGKEKEVDQSFEVEIPQDLQGHPVKYTPFSFACAQRQGKRKSQEDEYLLPVEVSFACKGVPMKGLLCGVFDGHGDEKQAGILLKECLAAMLSKILQDSCANVDSVSEDIIGNALTQVLHESSRVYQQKYRRGGTTASCAFILNGVIYFPNVGDSRTILVTPKDTYQVSEDARLENSKEELNIRFTKWHVKKGNEILDLRKYGWGFRLGLGGGLNMGRDIGNQGICSRPKIARLFIGERSDEKPCCKPGKGLLFISSDGLSAAATVEEVGREARKLIALGASLQQIADAFTNKAAAIPQSDNVTLMVVAI